MQIVKVDGNNKDFKLMCMQLENFQFNMIPILKEKEYSLTDDLNEISGYLLYDNEKPIGSIGLKKISDELCEIVRVFVLDEYRGNGYAGMLFEKIENLAKEQGFKKAEMVAWASAKSALRLYEKLGYLKTEEKVSEWFGGSKYVELYKNL